MITYICPKCKSECVHSVLLTDPPKDYYSCLNDDCDYRKTVRRFNEVDTIIIAPE